MRYLFFYIVFFVTGVCFSQDIPENILKDIEGNIYKTIKIGDQIWMKENLKVTKDPGGNQIISYCILNDTNHCKKYGRFYSWDVAMNNSEDEKSQGICPDGWHIPSDEEWTILIKNSGGYEHAGKSLQMNGATGFNILPLGNYNPEVDIYNYVGKQAYYWTATEFNANASWMRHFGKNQSNVNRSTVKKHYAFSIRCIKNIE